MGTLLELLPPGSAVAADGTLTIAGCRADELAEKFGTLVPPGGNQDVLVRVIPGVTADVHAHVMTGHEGSKFGLAPPAAVRLVLVAPRVGDLLVVPATGAYCFTMANNYNGTRRIPVVFARDGAARLVVRRETWEELSARDVE